MLWENWRTDTTSSPILDGARIFNATVALVLMSKRLLVVWIRFCFCLSKGLACPVGSVLAGSQAFIEEARRYRKMVGGGMRQAGVLAAAGLVALREMIDRLAEDHANARRLAEGLVEIPGIEVNLDSVQSNIVMFDLTAPKWAAEPFHAAMNARSVRFNSVVARRFRLVTITGSKRVTSMWL